MYILFFYTTFLFSFFDNLKQKSIFKSIFSIFFIIVFGFRNKIGVDWYNYQYFFDNFNSWDYLKDLKVKEFFFEFLNMDIGFKIISLFLPGNGEIRLLILNILISIWILISINHFIKKDIVLKKYYFSYLTFFLLLYFFLDVDILRQSIVFYTM
ncbi:EpsG family protein, partial [Cetobacterium sp.]|uniref:EpsG family protein n=1 Tax=Cetobacterium sp. TaxID=2071632 RepID=UPI003F2F7636